MAAVLDWRLPELAPTDPGPLPWLPGIPSTLHDHPVWGPYLAKRSQLVAELADQVQDQACEGDAEPAWAALGSQPTALVGEIAVWRAANGINPQDPRPTGGAQLETLPALWKQRLDRDIARATDRQLMQRPMSGSQRTSHLDAGTTTSSACTKNPNGVRAGRPRPADNTPQSSDRGARNMRLHSTRRWQDMQNRQHTAESGSFRSRRRCRHAAVRSLARCARSGPVLAPSARSWTRELEGIVLPRAAGRGGWPARSRSRGAQRGVRASEARGCIVPR
jgi:hypothetical protein